MLDKWKWYISWAFQVREAILLPEARNTREGKVSPVVAVIQYRPMKRDLEAASVPSKKSSMVIS
jgi:hypothetical protein